MVRDITVYLSGSDSEAFDFVNTLVSALGAEYDGEWIRSPLPLGDIMVMGPTYGYQRVFSFEPNEASLNFILNFLHSRNFTVYEYDGDYNIFVNL